MSNEDTPQQSQDASDTSDGSSQQDVNRSDSGQMTEKPEVTEEHRAKAREMHEAYEEDRPTTVLPGSGGTVAGTAVSDWVDDDGNPKFGDAKKSQSENQDQDSGEKAESHG
jgi:hypothetical protein